MQHRRRIAAFIGIAAVIAAPIVVGVTPATATPTQTQMEAPDYASETFGDAWDFSNAADVNTSLINRPATVANGHLILSLAGDTAVPLVDTTAGSLPTMRDGALHPIDTSRYNHLSFAMNQPLGQAIGAVYWFTCREKTAACGGGQTFTLVPGAHVYDLDLNASSTLLGHVPWSRSSVVAFRFDPAVLSAGRSATAMIDWIRLHGAGGSDAAMPPGIYGDTQVIARPEPVVDTPNNTQGADLASVQRKVSWTFTAPAAMPGITIKNARILGYSQTLGVTAVNSKPAINDPQVLLHVSPFSGSAYHWLSFDLKYDGGYSLADRPGGGKMARWIWWVQGNGTPQIGNDMLTFSGPNAHEVTTDLTAQNPLDENAAYPRLGWAGRTISAVRFDPNEDPSANVWHLRSIHLRQDPAVKGNVTVTFHDSAWTDGTTGAIQVNRAGTSTWTTVSSGFAVGQNENSQQFGLGSLPAGSYRIRVLMTVDGTTASGQTNTMVTITK